MASKLKEDERNERAIRALLKQSENRRCINCGSLGPQYVCTTFSIFVCTNCSGLHREFSHRIKSVSMAKFTAEEVKNLQTGGNERAREVFLKDYDLQRNPLPDSSNPDRLRDFIRGVYVEKRYSAPPRGRQGDREEFNDAHRPESRPDARYTAQSPPLEDRHDDRRYMERRRSDVDRGRYEDRVVRFEEKRSPSRLDPDRSRFNQKPPFDDRRQEDKPRSYERRSSYDDRFATEIRHDRRGSADDKQSAKDSDGVSPPVVRPVAEILGTNVPALWVEEYRHTNGRDEDDRSSHGAPADQRRDVRIPKLGAFVSVNGPSSVPTSAVIKRVNSGSLIDFTAEPEPSVAGLSATDPFGVAASPAPQSEPQPPAASTSSGGWATFDTTPAATLTVPAEGPPAGYPDVFLASAKSGDSWAAGGWPSSQPSSAPADDWSSLSLPNVQQQQSGTTASTSQALQHWNSFPLASSDVSHSEVTQLKQDGPPHSHEHTRSSSETANVGRPKELPKELFTHFYDEVGAMSTGGLAFGQQASAFPLTARPPGPGGMPTYAQPPRSRNPFDLPGDGTPSTGMGGFPNLGSLQAALPNGPMSVPSSGGSASSHQWSMGLQPASYPQSENSGSVFGSQLSVASSSGRQGQNTIPSFGFSESGSINSRGSSVSDSSFPAEFPAHTFLRTASGNPFG